MRNLLPGQDGLDVIVVERQILLKEEGEFSWALRNNKQTLWDICTWMLGRWTRPENEVRLLWSSRTVRRLENSSGGFKSTTLWKIQNI